ncbi:MAG: hypothetical protein J1F39_04995, partial [Clostridiales bacterium]|nr:hypothetical protein [Clostridiales bacterium]
PESQTVERGGTAVQPTVDAWEGHTLSGWYNGTNKWNFSTKIYSNITLKADWTIDVDQEEAQKYEQELTWGVKDHLYIHYLRGAHLAAEQGKVNPSSGPEYSMQIDSDVYGDWGLWVWRFSPEPGEGRAFYPMKIDESGAVYDIDLTATYHDAGWNAETRTNKGLETNYKGLVQIG